MFHNMKLFVKSKTRSKYPNLTFLFLSTFNQQVSFQPKSWPISIDLKFLGVWVDKNSSRLSVELNSSLLLLHCWLQFFNFSPLCIFSKQVVCWVEFQSAALAENSSPITGGRPASWDNAAQDGRLSCGLYGRPFTFAGNCRVARTGRVWIHFSHTKWLP